MEAEDREAALERRQEELDAKARDLRRINWKAWKKRGTFAFTATSAALMYDKENPLPATLAAIAAMLNVLPGRSERERSVFVCHVRWAEMA